MGPETIDQSRDQEASVQFRELFVLLRRRLPMLWVPALLGLIGAVAVNMTAVKMFTSSATIEVNKQEGSGLGLSDLSGIASQMGGGEELNVDLLTEQDVIQSSTIALSAIQRLNLLSVPPYGEANKIHPLNPADLSPSERERVLLIFMSHLKVSLIRDTRLITVEYTDQDPQRAADIANATVEAYARESTQSRLNASTRTTSVLSEQLSELKDKVIETQKVVSDYRQKMGLPGIAGMTPSRSSSDGADADSVAMSRFSDLSHDLTAAEVSRIAKEAIYRMTDTTDSDAVLSTANSQLALATGGSVLSSNSTDLALLTSLRGQRSAIELQIATQSNKFLDRAPEMMRLKTEIANLDAQILAELKHIHERARNEYELAKRTETGLRESIAKEQQNVVESSTRINKLALLEQEARSSRNLYQDLYTKLEEANVAAGIKSSNITIVEPARTPASSSAPRRLRNIVQGVALGLVGGLFAIFLLDVLNDRVVTPEQLERSLQLPLLSVIPLSKNKIEGQPIARPWVLEYPKSAIAEAFRILRSSLLLSRAGHPPRSILFTSALSGDGKSSICFNVGVTFALQGKRVLLIDADLRRPRLHVLTGVPNTIGVADYLTANDLKLANIVQQYGSQPNLDVLPCGPIPPLSAELLGSPRFTELLEEALKTYDFVLIDSPPVLLVTDAQLIAPKVEATLLVVRSNRISAKVLKRTVSRLVTETGKNVRMVLNALDYKQDAYFGYYNSGGYYSEEKRDR